MAGPLLIPVTAQDEAVLRQIYTETHAAHFASLDEAVRTPIVAMQFEAQRSQYRAAYPASTDHLIVVDGDTAGRCWTDLGDSELRLLDIAVRPAFAVRGIATAVLQDLLSAADRAGVALALSVWQDNIPARRLYAGLGLVEHEPARNGYLNLRAPNRQDTP